MLVTTRPRQVRKAASDPLDVAGPAALRQATTAMTAVLDALPRSVTTGDVEDAIRRGHGHRSAFLVDDEQLGRLTARIAGPLADAARRAAKAELHKFPARKARARNTLDFDLVSPLVVSYADERAADLVVEITQQTRATLRDLVTRAVNAEEGLASPRALATAVRSKIGLHSRWARAVLNYHFALQSEGIGAERREQLVARYYQRLLRARARNIARTEIIRASNAGKMQSWRAMQAEGWLGNAVLYKQWEAAADAEEICASVDGQQVPIDDLFSTSEGSFDMPPAHPSCRCTAALIPRAA